MSQMHVLFGHYMFVHMFTYMVTHAPVGLVPYPNSVVPQTYQYIPVPMSPPPSVRASLTHV